jgi:hypothetical protein
MNVTGSRYGCCSTLDVFARTTGIVAASMMESFWRRTWRRVGSFQRGVMDLGGGLCETLVVVISSGVEHRNVV